MNNDKYCIIQELVQHSQHTESESFFPFSWWNVCSMHYSFIGMHIKICTKWYL